MKNASEIVQEAKCAQVLEVGDIVTSIQYGYTASAKASSKGPRFLRITDIQNNNVSWCNVPTCSIPNEDINKYILESGDIVFARTGATTGKSFLIKNCPESIFASYLIRLRFNNCVLPEYVAHFFNSPSYWTQIEANKRGIGQPNVNATILSKIRLPVPSVACQKAIIQRLDLQFSRLEAGIAALKRAQANLKRYRASVLKAACEGQLVPTEYELATRRLQNSRSEVAGSAGPQPTLPMDSFESGEQLLQRILKERGNTTAVSSKKKDPFVPDIHTLPKIPEGWTWTEMSQLCTIFGGLTKNPRRSQLPIKHPYLRVANVYANEFRLENLETIGVTEKELESFSVKEGDLLLVEGNGSIGQLGRVAQWDGTISPILHQNHLIKARPVSKEIGKFILFWLSSQSGRAQIERVASSTSGLHTLSVRKVEHLPVPLPPQAELIRIVNEVEYRLSLLDQLDTTAKLGLTRSKKLSQSILQNTFA